VWREAFLPPINFSQIREDSLPKPVDYEVRTHFDIWVPEDIDACRTLVLGPGTGASGKKL
jgi:hypothetical protein